MTLAEALMERAELKAKISAVSDRIEDNILVQDNEAPGEDPKELLPELSASIQRLRVLISQINKTNCSTLIDGESLTDLIARRDCLLLEISSYRDFTETSRRSTDRARGSEIKIRPCIEVKELQKRCKEQLDIELTVRDSAKAFIVDKAYDRKYGARPLKRKLQEEIEDRMSEDIITGKIKRGDKVIISTKNKQISLTVE